MAWPKIFDKFKAVFRWGGKNQRQSIRGSQNVVASQSHGFPARSVLQAQVVVERHGYARTPTELFGDFDHAIRNYHKYAESEAVDPPALLVTDWDVMIIQMLFRDNDPLRERVRIVDGVITYQDIPFKHPTAGVFAHDSNSGTGGRRMMRGARYHARKPSDLFHAPPNALDQLRGKVSLCLQREEQAKRHFATQLIQGVRRH